MFPGGNILLRDSVPDFKPRKEHRDDSVDVNTLERPLGHNQPMHVKFKDVQNHFKHEDQAESIDSEDHPSASSPSSYEEIFSAVEDDDDVPVEYISLSGQVANHAQTAPKVNRETVY